jgi:hypothetical protein
MPVKTINGVPVYVKAVANVTKRLQVRASRTRSEHNEAKEKYHG